MIVKKKRITEKKNTKNGKIY